MEPLTIETFNTDMIQAVNYEQKKLVKLTILQQSLNTMVDQSHHLG